MFHSSDKKLEAFFATFPQKNLPKQQIIMGGVKSPKEIMFLQKGYVRQYIISALGDEETLMIYGPGDMFSLVWAVLGEERQYRYFESMTPVTLQSCSKDVFTQFLLSDPMISYTVLQQTLRRFDDFLQNTAYVSFSTKAHIKVLSFLLLLSQRFGNEKPAHILPFILTHKDIAGCIGLSRETVSIALKKLIDSGAVIQKEHFLGVAFGKKTNTYILQVQDLLK